MLRHQSQNDTNSKNYGGPSRVVFKLETFEMTVSPTEPGGGERGSLQPTLFLSV